MKILVIRFKFIGDVLLSSTLCSSLKRSFPESQIDFLMHASAAPLFAHHPAIDNVLSMSEAERKPLAYFKKIHALSKNNYDIIIDATSTNKSEFISLLSKGAQYRIGRHKRWRGWCYTHRVKKFNGDKIQQRLAMLQPLIDDGLTIKRDDQLAVVLSEQEKSIAHENIIKAGVNLEQPIFGFSVSSKLSYRLWNKEYMKRVIQHCLSQHNAQIILLPGMPHEQAYIDNLASELGNHPRVFSQIPATGIRELCALLSYCDLYVGNEGGPRHFAEAVGTPSVSVFSPSAELGEWLPGNRSEHRGIDWRSVAETTDEPVFENGDTRYYELYNLIKPEHVTALVDNVVEQHLVRETTL